MKVITFSLGLIIAGMAMAVNANPEAKDCLLIEAVGGATKLSNNCSETINATWFYDGACSAGCSQQIGSRIKGVWADLFKEPYTLGVCYAPEKVDPNWKGVGPAACDTSAGKHIDATAAASKPSENAATPVTTPVVGASVEIGAAGITKSTKTDPKGEFHFQELPAGEYALKVDGKPFKSVTVSENGLLIGQLAKGSDGKIEFTNIHRLTWK